MFKYALFLEKIKREMGNCYNTQNRENYHRNSFYIFRIRKTAVTFFYVIHNPNQHCTFIFELFVTPPYYSRHGQYE